MERRRRAFTTGQMAAHNDVLETLAETGVPGLLIYLAFLATVFTRLRRTVDPAMRAGLLGLLVAAFVASMGNPSIHGKEYWIQMSACVLGGLVFGKQNVARAGLSSTRPGLPATAACGPPPLPTGGEGRRR